jgi:hypothetical protein
VGRFLWPSLIIAAVVLGLVVSASGTQTRNRIEYMSGVSDSATELAKGAEALSQITEQLHLISRVDFEAVIAGIQEDLSATAEFIAEEPPDSSLLPVRSLYRQAVNAWTRGVEGFSEAALLAADRPNDPTALDLMAAALAELRTGDGVYAELLVEMEREDMPSTLTPLPEVIMQPEEGGLVALSLDYVSAARSELNSLGLRPGLGISQIVSDPEWDVDANGQVALPSTETLTFSVVMTNTGNIASTPQELVLTMLGGPDPVSLSQEVPTLQPGRQITLLFEPVVVAPGGIYEVSAEIESIAEDLDIEDNRIAVQFTVNEG